MAGITLTLVLMLSANLAMVWQQQKRDVQADMYGKAKMITQQLIATRLFIARNQDRINVDSNGHFEFKGLNPAAVGRGVGDIFQELTGATLKQTRFQVRRPSNAPDKFEWEALTAFSENDQLKEFFAQVEQKGEPVYRYAVPLQMEAECLRCHGEPAGTLDVAGYPREGYKLGQLGGAISVSLPMSEAIDRIQANAVTQIWVIAAITLTSLIVIYLLSRNLVTNPLQRLASIAARIGSGRLLVRPAELEPLKRSVELGIVAGNIEVMAMNLRDLYQGLEAKVAERTRELAEANRNLEQANQLQSQFLATVSHELRTPLTSIIAFTELLLAKAEGKNREYLEDVAEASRHLLVMVNNLLDLSRSEAGRLQVFTDVVDLPELVIPLERSLRPLAESQRIDLKVRPMEGLPLLMVDPLRIKQVLMNVIGNAIKFTPAGGSVTVAAAPRDGWVEVSVEDTGPGIAPEHRALVFEAFRRIESKGEVHPGTGLGLALAKNLVELHGGRIWVEDGAHGGSRFLFTLPVVPDPHSEEVEPDGSR